MYLEHYRLNEFPFNVTPDPKFLYLTEQHRTALNHLLYGIRQRRGFVLLTGEVGTGKTTLCRRVLECLEPTTHTALILNPILTSTQLLRAIVEEFGIEHGGRDRLGHLRALNAFLLRENSQGRDAVLVVDEAQDMSVELLEMVRLLSNLETNSQKLLQILLVGQPELRTKLRSASLRQLAQRITVHYHLTPMNQPETGEYIRHRLTVAGNDGAVRFDDDAVTEIYQMSNGTPRLVNTLGDKSLLAGYVMGACVIDRWAVRRAVEDMQEAPL